MQSRYKFMALVSERRERRWRFAPGDHVHVRGWNAAATAIVTAPAAHLIAPHYFVVDDDGHEWRIPQIHLSQRIIEEQ